MGCWCGCLSGARCRLFAYGPADATDIPKPHHLLPHFNPDWFYLSDTGLPRLSWKRGRQMGACCLVSSADAAIVHRVLTLMWTSAGCHQPPGNVSTSLGSSSTPSASQSPPACRYITVVLRHIRVSMNVSTSLGSSSTPSASQSPRACRYIVVMLDAFHSGAVVACDAASHSEAVSDGYMNTERTRCTTTFSRPGCSPSRLPPAN